jgi:hypothetical protein
VGVGVIEVYIWCGLWGIFFLGDFFIFLYIKTGKGQTSLLCKAVFLMGGAVAYTVSESYMTDEIKVILDAKKKTPSANADRVF